MHVIKIILAVIAILGCLVISATGLAQQISLTDQEAEWIGNKIFRNECAGNNDYLVTWNSGEEFMSLGIGHFIWYPAGKRGPFHENFPALLRFIKQKDKGLPAWLEEREEPHCPWGSREEFLGDQRSSKVYDLRKFLTDTKDLQLIFIVNRLQAALPKMLNTAPVKLRPHIEKQFYHMAATPYGMYALVDYVNFKGEGTLATERYNGQGWGLLQVLERMDGTENGVQAVREFVKAADKILTERVNNSPPERNEQLWLPGWKNRLNTYIQESVEYSA